MTEHEEGSTSEASSEARRELWLALVAALLFLAPLALAELTLVHLLLAWAALLLVYVALLRLFGLRSVIEVALLVFLMSACSAGVLWLSSRQTRQEEPLHVAA